MATYYITFGQVHVHRVNGITFDSDCVCTVEAPSEEKARAKVFKAFSRKWCMCYSELPDMEYYPRGLIPLD